MKHVLTVVAVFSLLSVVGSETQAVTLFWDANGAPPYAGGAGTWNTTDARWVANSGDTTGYVAWNNAASPADSATFEAPAGNPVILGGPITVNQITTALSGYTFGNGNINAAANTIVFSGTGAGINTATTGTTTLSAVVNGTLTKTGPGRLELNNGFSPDTVKYILNGGIISTNDITRLSLAAPGLLVPDFITFNGGGWAVTTNVHNTGATRGITIKAGGAFFGASVLGATNTISSPIAGTEGGDITLTGGAPFAGNGSVTAGVVLTLTNTGNSFDGDIFVNGPSGTTLRGALNVVPDTAIVNLQAAGNQFDLATNRRKKQ